MSYSASVAAGPKADFDAAVDAAQPSPPLTTDEAKAQFAAGQAAAKALVASFDNAEAYVGASISGHACQQDGDFAYDSITVSVAEYAAPAPAPAESETTGSDGAVADAELGTLTAIWPF